MIGFYKYLVLFLVVFLINSCASTNKEKKDTSELYKKSQTRQAIVERSGTIFSAGSNARDKREQLIDAENRLRTGGGLFGKKAGFDLLGNNNDSSQTVSMGMPINPYLWKGSLETVNFMPLMSADPFSGIIITDWYSANDIQSERCKINIFIKGVELNSRNLKVNSFCQKLNSTNIWVDQETDNENNIQLENAIFNKAKKIRLANN